MIQVLKRSSDIIEYLTEHSEAKISDIADGIGIKFTTACNIVKTMVSLGWLEKHDSVYRIGKRFTKVAEQEINKNIIAKIAEEKARELSDRIKEGVIISMFYKNQKYTMAKAVFEEELIVNMNTRGTARIYGASDTRVLLAYLNEVELRSFVELNGLPGAEWDSVKSYNDLVNALAEIKKAGISIRFSRNLETIGVAMPVFSENNKVWTAIGIFLPKKRFKGAHRKEVINCLGETAKQMSFSLSYAKS